MNKACIACKYSAICVTLDLVDIVLKADERARPDAHDVPDDCPVLEPYKQTLAALPEGVRTVGDLKVTFDTHLHGVTDITVEDNTAGESPFTFPQSYTDDRT